MMKKRIIGVVFGEKKIACEVKETEDGLFAGAKFEEQIPVVENPCDICEAEDIEDAAEETTVEIAATLFDAFNRYILMNEGILAPSTIKTVENIRDKHLQGLMSMSIFDISDDDIQLALDEELSKGISAATIKKYRQTVKRVIAACD